LIDVNVIIMCCSGEQFLHDYDIAYCSEHVFYDVRVSLILLTISLSPTCVTLAVLFCSTFYTTSYMQQNFSYLLF